MPSKIVVIVREPKTPAEIAAIYNELAASVDGLNGPDIEVIADTQQPGQAFTE